MNCKDQDNQIDQNPCIGKPSTIARGYGGRPNALPALRMRQQVIWCGHVGCSPLRPSRIPRSTPPKYPCSSPPPWGGGWCDACALGGRAGSCCLLLIGSARGSAGSTAACQRTYVTGLCIGGKGDLIVFVSTVHRYALVANLPVEQ